MLDQFSEVIYLAKGIVRNKWIIAIVAWLVCIGGWIYIYKMPDVYESSARVHVDTRTMLRPLLRGMAVQSDVRGLVRIMQKLMFTQHNMLKVAELAGMDVDIKATAKFRALIEKLKKKVTIEGGLDEIFTIKYESQDPQNAKNVVQAVLSVFSEQTQQSTLSDVDSAQRFIDNQIRKYEKRLRNAERAKENFKRENIGLLPGQEGEGQFSVIRSIRKTLQNVQMVLSEMLSRKKVLQMQLSEALESGEEWGLTEIVNASSVEDARITELEHRKSDLLLKFTDNHPVIGIIDKEIKALLQRKEEVDSLNDLDENTDNPYHAMSSTYAQSIKIELNRIEVEIATNSSRIVSLKKKLQKEDEQFNERLATETEMQNLNRDYSAIKKNYLTLIERREKARMSSNIDTQVSALKFKIADPANIPLQPSAPNRLLLYSVILALGFLAGAALALLKVFIRPSFIEAKQVKEITELPVLGTISEVVNEAQAKNNFVRLIGFISVNVLLLIVYSGVMLLDVLS